jgi:glycosyltransferase involved in cell wall biosynthesis
MHGGGAEKQLCELVKIQKKRGLDVHVVLIEEGINYTYLISTRAVIHKIKSSSYYSFEIYLGLKDLFLNHKPDIVQCWQRPMDFFASLAAIRLSIPFVLSERTNPNRYTFTIKGLVKLFLMQFSSGVASNSLVGFDFWRKSILGNKIIIYTPNILPIASIEQASQIKRIRPYFISVGRLVSNKNHLNVIKAFAKSEIETHDLLIIGDGPLYSVLSDYIHENNLEKKIELLRYKTNVIEYLKGADGFISLSKVEGMPNAVLEAAACHLPLVLSDINEHTSIFKSGVINLCGYDDIEKTSRFIKQLVLKKQNIQYPVIYEFSDEKIFQLYYDQYKKILSRIRNN